MQQIFSPNPAVSSPPHKRGFRIWMLIFILILGGYIAIAFSRHVVTENMAQTDIDDFPFWKRVVARILPISADRTFEDPDYIMPVQEPDRSDILILGLRGKDDPDGGLLTDSIMLFSFDETTHKTALVSIPRDLSIKITDTKTEKINAALEELGMNGTKKLVSKLTGIYVDNIVVFDFVSFEKIINEIGGIDVRLDQPFQETSQWGSTFYLPAGDNHLDGQTALYYVRSRFSSSDFDRARRQQQVISAIKKKTADIKLLSDPLKVLGLISTLKSDIQTDFNILDINGLLGMAREFSASLDTMKRHVISTDNLLYESRDGGTYVLLPKGDTFEQLKIFFRDILG